MRFLKSVFSGSRRAAIAMLRAVPAFLRDVVGITGSALVIYGVWQIYVPAGYILAGLVMVVAAILLARRSA